MKIKSEDLSKVKAFTKEKDIFYVISLIAKEDSILYSDLKTYIIAQSDMSYPIWIYTIDNFPKEKIKELKSELDMILKDKMNTLTSRREIYELLENEYQISDYFEMGVMTCTKVIKPAKGEGQLLKADSTDKITLCEYWRGNMKELNNQKISQQEALLEVENWLEEENIYVLKNNKDIVSMAMYNTSGEYAKISHVYTPKEERGKGYCQYLMYSLGKSLIEEGYKLVLYTDNKYLSSNIAYEKVGFQKKGILIKYKVQKR